MYLHFHRCFKAEFQLHRTDLNFVDINTGWPFDARLLTVIADPLPIVDKIEKPNEIEKPADEKEKPGDGKEKPGDGNDEGANNRLLPGEDSVLLTEAPDKEVILDGKKIIFPQVKCVIV